MNLIAKIRSLQAQIDELRARLEALTPIEWTVDEIKLPPGQNAVQPAAFTQVVEQMRLQPPIAPAPFVSAANPFMQNAARAQMPAVMQLPTAIAPVAPIASATIAPPPAKRRGRPPKPKV